MCIGARPPFDHPHIFCDMGDDNEIICEYCSTLYRYDPKLDPHESRPADCAWTEPAGRLTARSPAAVASSRTILIAGAGIGGLTAALTLARAGYPRRDLRTGRDARPTSAPASSSPRTRPAS